MYFVFLFLFSFKHHFILNPVIFSVIKNLPILDKYIICVFFFNKIQFKKREKKKKKLLKFNFKKKNKNF